MNKDFDPDNFVVLSCKAAMPFTERIIEYLGRYNGSEINSFEAQVEKSKSNGNHSVRLGKIKTRMFPGGEPKAKLETNVRLKNVHIFQCFRHSDEIPILCYDLVELLVVLDMLKRAKTGKIFVYVPFLPFQRQEKKKDGREPISAKMIFDIISVTAGKKLEDIVTSDLHAPAAEGFFDGPVDHIISWPLFALYIQQVLNLSEKEIVIVSPDAGGAARAKQFAKNLKTRYAIINKDRDEDGRVIAEDLVGSVAGKIAIIIDDMISTGGSLVEAHDILVKYGAIKVYAFGTHGLFCVDQKKKLPAEKRLFESNIDVVTTDAIPEKHQRYYDTCYKWLKGVITLGPYFSDTLFCNETGESLSDKMNEYEDMVRINSGNIKDFLLPIKPLEVYV